MIVDVTEPVKDYLDKPVNGPDGEPVMVRNLIFQALNTTRQNEQLPPADALKAGMLTQAVMSRDKVKLAAADVTFVLERSGLVNPPLAHFRLTQVLDPDALPPDTYGNLDEDVVEDGPGE